MGIELAPGSGLAARRCHSPSVGERRIRLAVSHLSRAPSLRYSNCYLYLVTIKPIGLASS